MSKTTHSAVFTAYIITHTAAIHVPHYPEPLTLYGLYYIIIHTINMYNLCVYQPKLCAMGRSIWLQWMVCTPMLALSTEI